MAHDVVAEVLTLTVNARTYAGSCSALRRAQGTPSQVEGCGPGVQYQRASFDVDH
jgi:hypothetical protein